MPTSSMTDDVARRVPPASTRTNDDAGTSGTWRGCASSSRGAAARVTSRVRSADGATDRLTLARPTCPHLEQLWADGASDGFLVEWTRCVAGGS